MNKIFPRINLPGIIHKLQDSGLDYFYDYRKHRLVFVDNMGSECFYVRLPFTVKHSKNDKYFTDENVKYIIVLIQSGNSALGYVEEDRIIKHKVITSYMIRKKQGKSQVKYLKTKGKSRAGSRIRLANTLHFFERINGYLQTYWQHYQIDRIALSCSKILLPYLYNSKVKCPLDKEDERIYRIPTHINRPNYTILQRTQKYLTHGEIFYKPSHQSLIENIL